MNTLPEQNRIQPHHSINMPNMAFNGDGKDPFCFVRNAPRRGLSIRVATSPDIPPTKCTGPHPENVTHFSTKG